MSGNASKINVRIQNKKFSGHVVSIEELASSLEECLKTDPHLVPGEAELPNVIKKATDGDALSQHLYACHFEMQKDYKQAMEFYEKAAKQNFVYSVYNLASMYAEGKGGKVDSTKALFYLTSLLSLNMDPHSLYWQEFIPMMKWFHKT